MSPNNWGGKREGAGGVRKYGQPTVKKSVRIPTNLAEVIARKAKESGISQSEFIVGLIEAYAEDH